MFLCSKLRESIVIIIEFEHVLLTNLNVLGLSESKNHIWEIISICEHTHNNSKMHSIRVVKWECGTTIKFVDFCIILVCLPVRYYQVNLITQKQKAHELCMFEFDFSLEIADRQILGLIRPWLYVCQHFSLLLTVKLKS